jgi:hypothetical protein
MRARIRFKRPQRAEEEIDATDAAWILARQEWGYEAEAFLASVEGTGKNGRVTVSDVRAALAE